MLCHQTRKKSALFQSAVQNAAACVSVSVWLQRNLPSPPVSLTTAPAVNCKFILQTCLALVYIYIFSLITQSTHLMGLVLGLLAERNELGDYIILSPDLPHPQSFCPFLWWIFFNFPDGTLIISIMAISIWHSLNLFKVLVVRFWVNGRQLYHHLELNILIASWWRLKQRGIHTGCWVYLAFLIDMKVVGNGALPFLVHH